MSKYDVTYIVESLKKIEYVSDIPELDRLLDEFTAHLKSVLGNETKLRDQLYSVRYALENGTRSPFEYTSYVIKCL